MDASLLSRAGRLKKDPLSPKQPRSAYFHFLGENRPALVADSSSRMTVPEVTRALAERWKALSEAERTPYQQRAAEDQERYRRELASYMPIRLKTFRSGTWDGEVGRAGASATPSHGQARIHWMKA